MNLPKPPEEAELKNIIDKLANFVARNGLEFEHMTKSKQKNNPKFSFLFGGDHYSYYQFKLATEQQIINHQQSRSVNQDGGANKTIQNAPWQQQQQSGFNSFQNQPKNNPASNQTIPPWQQNSAAPWQNQQKNQQQAAPDGLSKLEQDLQAQEEDVQNKVKESESNLKKQHNVLMAKQADQLKVMLAQWDDESHKALAEECGISLSSMNNILSPIIETCTKDSIANGKSWILAYSESDKSCRVVCKQILMRIKNTHVENSKDDQEKNAFDVQLHLIYLVNDVLHHASRKKLTFLSNALEEVIVEIFALTYSNANEIQKERLQKLLGLWTKFKYFNSKTMEKLSNPTLALEICKNDLEIRFKGKVDEIKHATQKEFDQFQNQHKEYTDHIQKQLETQKKYIEDQKASMQPNVYQTPSNQPPVQEGIEMRDYNQANVGPRNPPRENHGNWQGGNNPIPPGGNWNRGPNVGPNQQWGPGSSNIMDDPALIPKVPYYDLPAGLMAPLVHLKEMDYKEIDPTQIRLPPPVQPSNRLLAAVEAFYSAPCHERPRNPDGWEQNGLFEFFRAKTRAKRQAEQGSISPSPRRKSRSYSRSSSGSRSRSSSSRSSSRSDRSRSRSRSRERTPPFQPAYFAPPQERSREQHLSDDNRGAQMMKKMGWGGAGLGMNEQGMNDPVKAGDVRENFDKFKGLGMELNDPYENYRKNRSHGYVSRIRSREAEREKM